MSFKVGDRVNLHIEFKVPPVGSYVVIEFYNKAHRGGYRQNSYRIGEPNKINDIEYRGIYTLESEMKLDVIYYRNLKLEKILKR